MRVLLAVHHFPPRYTGGAEWRAYRTAAALQAHGHQVSVICVERLAEGPAGGVAWTDDVYQEVRVRRLSFNLTAAPDRFTWLYNNPWIGEHLQGLMAELHPDLFHLFSGYLMTGSVLRAAQRLGIPAVVSLTDFWFLCPRIQMLRTDGRVSTLPIRAARCARCLGEEKRRYRWLGRFLPGVMDNYWRLRRTEVRKLAARAAFLREALNGAAAIISPSQFVQAFHIQAGIDPGRMIYCRQGHDFPNLTEAGLKKTPAACLRVGYLGQVAEIKGVHLLFEAVRHLPASAVQALVYGDTAPYPAYTRRLSRLAASDSRLCLAGTYPREALSRILRTLDVIVVPSLWYENSPNVILEAFAHRTPVIASNLGGMAELVQPGKNGLLFAPGDARDLARQLQRLLAEPALLPTLRTGIEPIRTVADEMDQLEAIYSQVVGGGQA